MAKYIVKVSKLALLAADNAKTVFQLISGAAQAELAELHISFNGVTPTDVAAYWEIVRQTTAGTATNTAQVPVKGNTNDGACLTTYSRAFTVEPTSPGDSLLDGYLTPNGGALILPLSGIWIPTGGGTTGRIGLVIWPTANVNVNAAIHFLE